MPEQPKVFISYSWTNPNHESWVINLAERLISDGVDVAIDKWDLKEGHDKFNFMETMVESPDIEKVLIILDKTYSQKADQRAGGVGTETQIISPNIYSNVSQEKFIPIISERDEDGNAFIPTYLKGRIYIDLVEQERYEENYESLLRNIFKRPAYSKPKIGNAPSYLFDETPMSYKTSLILRGFDSQLEKNPKRINSIIRDFLEEFHNDLKKFTIPSPSRDVITLGKEIYDNINAYTPLRNDYINFLDKIIKSEIEFDIELIIGFFEKLPLLNWPQDEISSWGSNEFDNFKFFTHELFLYSIVIGLKNENYKFVEEILNSTYFFQDKYNNSNKEPQGFGKLYNHIDIIKQYYNRTYSKDFHSPMADIMIKRVPENLNRDHLIDADLLCYYVAKLNDLRWFPLTYIYRTSGNFPLFDRLISFKHFEKIKLLFNVHNVQELKEKLTFIRDNDKNPNGIGYSNAWETVAPLYEVINIEKIATVR